MQARWPIDGLYTRAADVMTPYNCIIV